MHVSFQHDLLEGNNQVVLGPFNPLSWDLIWYILATCGKATSIDKDLDRKQIFALIVFLARGSIRDRSPNAERQAIFADTASPVQTLKIELKDISCVYRVAKRRQVLHTARR